MDPFIYRECRATITARIPDTPDADAHPDRVLVQGRGTAHPQFQGGSVVFTEIGEYAIPQPIPVVIVDGELLVEVLAGDESVETQPLYLPVTVDERANQNWSWRLTFDFLTLGEYGDEVAHPPLSFPVEAGDGPLEISTVATPAIKSSGFISRGPRGFKVTSVTAGSGQIVFEWEDGTEHSVPMPDSVPGPPPTVEWDGPHLVVEGQRGPDLRGPNSIPTEEAIDTVLVERMQGRPISAAAEGAYPGATGLAEKLNAAALKAEATGVPLILSAGDHILDDEFLFGSKTTVEGVRGVTWLTQTTPGKAVMKSRNVAHNGAPTGQTVIRNLQLIGEQTHPESHGIVFRDYFSVIENVRISRTGGDGIHATHLNGGGTPYGGASLVENRIQGVDVYNVKGYGIFVGAMDNGKFTDHRLSDIYIHLDAGAKGGIYGGLTGGWELNNIHIYGNPVPVAIDLWNLNSTQMSGIYVESSWTEAAIKLSRIQRSVNMDNLVIKGTTSTGGRAISLASRSSIVDSAEVNIDNLAIFQANDVPLDGIYLPTGTIRVRVGNYSVDGTFPGRVTKFGGFAANQIKRVSDAIVDGALRDSPGGKSLEYQGQPLAQTRRTNWSGGGEKTLTLPLPDFSNHDVIHARLGLGSVSNYNGAARTRWVADVLFTSKAAGDAWQVYPEVLNTPTGFDVQPEVAVDKATRTVSVTFTPSHSDGYGTLGMSLDYH